MCGICNCTCENFKDLGFFNPPQYHTIVCICMCVYVYIYRYMLFVNILCLLFNQS